MPGIIVKVSCQEQQSVIAERSIHHDDRYVYAQIFLHNNVEIAMNSYPGYPVHSFETERYFCVVEGCMYGADVQAEGEAIIQLIETQDSNAIAERIGKLDGEFVVLVYHKATSEINLFNDSWGRLPTYYFSDETGMVITREISFLHTYFEKLPYAKMELAFFLLFGYSLGDNTLYEGVKKLPPHACVHCGPNQKGFKIESSFSFRHLFEKGKEPDVKNLQKELVKGLNARLSLFKSPSLSLSGGLDSRLLAGIWKLTRAPALFTTFNRPDRYANLDVKVAKEISKSLDEQANHKLIEMAEPLDVNRDKIVSIKRGMNGQEMAFLVPYFQEISRYSDCSISGDGGDKFFVNLFPLTRVASRKKLLDCILKFHAGIEIKVVAKICGVSEKEIMQKLSDTIDGYQLNNPDEEYAAFQLRERGINWLFEGEDRNRFFLWSTSPYYHPEVIRNAMRFSMKSKRYGVLFKRIFEGVPGDLDTLNNPYWGSPPSATRKIKWTHDKQRVKARIPRLFLRDSRASLRDTNVYDMWNAGKNIPFDLNPFKNLKLTIPALNRLETLVRLQQKD